MTTTDEKIDAYAYSPRQATVAKVLAKQYPTEDARTVLDDARAVLLALGEVEGAPPPTGEESGLVDDEEYYGLSVEQETRARALDSAAKLLGPGVGEVFGEAPYESVVGSLLEEWLGLAAAGAHFIETGRVLPDPPPSAEPAPPSPTEAGAA